MGQLSKKWLLASYNPGKAREIGALLAPAGINVACLGDGSGPRIDWNETADTFLGNALIKVRAVATAHPDEVILADDSGLMVDALGGDPGVHSSTFAGPDASDHMNSAKLVATLQGYNASRCRSDSTFSARFACTMVLRDAIGEERSFVGEMKGHMILAPRGSGGFGYDSLFVPMGESRTLAEMSLAEKNKISHRAAALAQVMAFAQTMFE